MEIKSNNIEDKKYISFKENGNGKNLINGKDPSIISKKIGQFQSNKKILNKKRKKLKEEINNQKIKVSKRYKKDEEISEKEDDESYEEYEENKENNFDEKIMPDKMETEEDEEEKEEYAAEESGGEIDYINKRPRAKNYVIRFEKNQIDNKLTYYRQIFKRLKNNHLIYAGIFENKNESVCFIRFGKGFNYNENKNGLKSFDYIKNNTQIVSPKVSRGFKKEVLYNYIINSNYKFLSPNLNRYFYKKLLPRYGQQNNLKKFETMKRGRKKFQINHDENNLKYNNNQEKKENEKEYIWIYGPKGVGKFHVARESCNDNYYFKKLSKDWDGYKNEETVISIIFFIAKKEEFDYLEEWIDKDFNPGKNNGKEAGKSFKKLIVIAKEKINDICHDNPEICKKLKSKFKIIEYIDRKLHDRILDWLKNPSKIPSVLEQRRDYINLTYEN